jgi:hypothetical protein
LSLPAILLVGESASGASPVISLIGKRPVTKITVKLKDPGFNEKGLVINSEIRPVDFPTIIELFDHLEENRDHIRFVNETIVELSIVLQDGEKIHISVDWDAGQTPLDVAINGKPYQRDAVHWKGSGDATNCYTTIQRIIKNY